MLAPADQQHWLVKIANGDIVLHLVILVVRDLFASRVGEGVSRGRVEVDVVYPVEFVIVPVKDVFFRSYSYTWERRSLLCLCGHVSLTLFYLVSTVMPSRSLLISFKGSNLRALHSLFLSAISCRTVSLLRGKKTCRAKVPTDLQQKARTSALCD